MPSVQSQLMRFFLKSMSSKSQIQREKIINLRHRLEIGTSLYRIPKEVRIEPVSAGGIIGEWVIPLNAHPDHIFYYLHGGGYCLGSCNSHRFMAVRLARASGLKVLHISYRLAPEYPFPAAVNDCFAVYEWLLNERFSEKSIVIGGESAGGMFTLTTLILARDRGLPMPSAGFCFSPHLDFTFQNKSLTKCEPSELFFSHKDLKEIRQIYVGDHDPLDPLISPLYADLSGLPPLLVHVANPEMLLEDATRLAAYAKQAGVEVELKLWPGMFHAFQLVPFLPESKMALNEMIFFAKKKLAGD